MRSSSGVLRRLPRLRRAKKSRGAAAVEAAVILPVLVIITLGIIKTGTMPNNQITLNNAARNGAQYASGSTIAAIDTIGITAAATAELTTLPYYQAILNPAVTSTYTNTGDGHPYVTVTVNYKLTSNLAAAPNTYTTLSDSFVMPVQPTISGGS